MSNDGKSEAPEPMESTAAPIGSVSKEVLTDSTSLHGSGGPTTTANQALLSTILDKLEHYDGTDDIRPWLDDLDSVGQHLTEMEKRMILQLSLKGNAKQWLQANFGNRVSQTESREIITKLREHFTPNIHERDYFYKMTERVQGPNESVTNYISAMQTIWKGTGREVNHEFFALLIQNAIPKIRKQLRRLPHNASIEAVRKRALEVERELEHTNREVRANKLEKKKAKEVVFQIEEQASKGVEQRIAKIEEIVLFLAENRKRKEEQTSKYEPAAKRRSDKLCSFCKKRGHVDTVCWLKDPSKKPARFRKDEKKEEAKEIKSTDQKPTENKKD